ncbi:38988_t:CDS:1, partial [Gigaspora margarita]
DFIIGIVVANSKISLLELPLLIVELRHWCHPCDFTIGELSSLVSVLQE